MQPSLVAVLVALACAAVSLTAHGQNAPVPSPRAFEVVSIKRSTVERPQRSGFIPTPGRFVAEHIGASALINFAYRGEVSEVKGAPEWSRSERYTIMAILPPGASPDDVPGMLRTLLKERFDLAFHVTQDERDVLALVRVDPNAPLPAGFERIEQDCNQITRYNATSTNPLARAGDGHPRNRHARPC